MKNIFKTGIYMLCLTFLFLWIGYIFGGSTGIVIAFICAFVMNFLSYWYSDKIVLAIYRAKPVSYSEYPQLYNIVGELTRKIGIPSPQIYI